MNHETQHDTPDNPAYKTPSMPLDAYYGKPGMPGARERKDVLDTDSDKKGVIISLNQKRNDVRSQMDGNML